jgi:hypothetical protein
MNLFAYSILKLVSDECFPYLKYFQKTTLGARVMRKKFFGHYAGGGGGGVFGLFLAQIYKKCSKGGGVGVKMLKNEAILHFL